MAAIPLLSGIFTDDGPDFRRQYPVNLVPVPVSTGISNAYLRPAEGIVLQAAGPGINRGGIEWNNVLYRVQGEFLVRIDSAGAITTLGSVGNDDQRVVFDYSFDRLAIASAGNLFYWNGTTLTQVTDPDLGTVLDFVWVDGYFMTTDGTSLIVTELTDPTQVNPLKYGSSEVDPDPVVGLVKLRNEVYAINRHTIEVFDNVGGEFFPFQRIDGAQIQKGAVGTLSSCVFAETIAFVGGGRNEAVSVYLGVNGGTTKIATREIDDQLRGYSNGQLEAIYCESRVYRAHQQLLVHCPDRTLVYDLAASQAVGEPVWFILTSSSIGYTQYRAQGHVWCYDRWNVGDPASGQFGYLDDEIGSHYGNKVRWEFMTQVLFNEGRGAMIHELELTAMTGRVAMGKNPAISTSFSVDGETWGQDHTIRVGEIGQRDKRLCWFRQGFMRNFRIQRFRGDSDAHIGIAALNARLEPLAY